MEGLDPIQSIPEAAYTCILTNYAFYKKPKEELEWLERMKALAISRCGAQGDNHSAIAIVVTEGTEDAN